MDYYNQFFGSSAQPPANIHPIPAGVVLIAPGIYIDSKTGLVYNPVTGQLVQPTPASQPASQPAPQPTHQPASQPASQPAADVPVLPEGVILIAPGIYADSKTGRLYNPLTKKLFDPPAPEETGMSKTLLYSIIGGVSVVVLLIFILFILWITKSGK